jgi:hypothetical protein
VALPGIGSFGARQVDANGTFMDFDGAAQPSGANLETRGMLVEAADGTVLKRYYVNVYPALTVSGSLGPAVQRGYPRPRGATPFRVSLTPAYRPCTSPNRQHGAPLAVSSCNPPQQTSSRLTVGTLDANGQPANSVGFVRYDVLPGDPSTTGNGADVAVTASVTDVRRQGTLADYTGELGVQQLIQITDRLNGPGQDEPATAQATPFSFAVPCAATSDAGVGATCSISSTFNAILPGLVVEEKRANWELGKVDVYDGGTDDLFAPGGDDTLFETQGVFAP